MLRSMHIAAGLLAAAATALIGCSAYDHRYIFEPGPVDVETVPPGGEEGEPARTLVTVIGVRKADRDLGLPESVEIRLRVENAGSGEVRFDPASLVLFSAGLERFPDPMVRPRQPQLVAPGEHATVEAWFPFPEGLRPSDMDLGGVNVRWTLTVDGQPVTRSATFQRLPDAYYDRYRHRIGVGYQGHSS